MERDTLYSTRLLLQDTRCQLGFRSVSKTLTTQRIPQETRAGAGFAWEAHSGPRCKATALRFATALESATGHFANSLSCPCNKIRRVTKNKSMMLEPKKENDVRKGKRHFHTTLKWDTAKAILVYQYNFYAKQILSLYELLCDVPKFVRKVKHVLFLDQSCLYTLPISKDGARKTVSLFEHCMCITS